METIAQEKIGVRQRMIAKLKALSLPEARAKSAAICHRLAEVHELWGVNAVCGFISFGVEVHTHDLVRGFLAERKHVSVPSFDPVGQRYICSELKHFETDLAEGLMGILEPKHSAIRPVRVDIPDAWLVPGLAFDEKGNRLGRGKGYYDQLLRNARGVKVALAYDFQVLNEVPAEAHDVRMDFIVTETRVVQCQRK